jgi:hypothetical protein
MSSVYTKNKKELAGVKLVSATEVGFFDKNNIRRFRRDISIVGKIDIATPNMVLKANRQNKPTGYIDDVASLPNRTKQEIIGHFYDKNGERNGKRIAYLIRTDKKSVPPAL